LSKIAFWGDSLTEGKPGAAFLEILQAVQQNHTIVNHGKGGDTILSLYKRVEKLYRSRPEQLEADIIFIWVGVNDILPDLSGFYVPIKTAVRQPWTSNDTEFDTYYRRVVEILHPRCRRLWLVAPLFLGEDLKNNWNDHLNRQSQLIKELAHSFSHADFFDIRRPFAERLSSLEQAAVPISPYLPDKLFPAAIDFLLHRSASKADRRAEKRGLHFTMDGVHFNSTGAHIVADEFIRLISS